MKNAGSKKTPLFVVEAECEEDGRRIVEIPDIPGAMAYGSTKQKRFAELMPSASARSQTA